MKHIVFLTPQFKTGGGNRVFIELANELVKKGCAIDVIYPYNSLEKNTFFLNEKINVFRLGVYSRHKLFKILNVIYTFIYVSYSKKRCKIIISDPVTSIFAIILSGLDVNRFIQADDYNLFNDLYLLKNKVVLSLYKFLTKASFHLKINYIFNSGFSYSKFLTYSGRKDVKFNLVHPALNHDVFLNNNSRKDNELNICLIAKKHPFKGFGDFLKAWQEVEHKLLGKVTNVFIIYDNEGYNSLKNPIFKLFHPKNDIEIADIYNNSHIFISTSWSEGFGLPPLEAMACGCAVILANSGGVNEYAESEYNCLLYEPRKIEQLKEKIISLIGNPVLIKKLAVNGGITAKRFSWGKSADKFLEIIGE